MMFQQFGGITGVGFYASFSSGKIGMIVCACIQIPITAVGTLLVDNCGRKPLLLVSSIGTFLGCFLVAMSFLMKEHHLLQNWIPLLYYAADLLKFIRNWNGTGSMDPKVRAGSLVNLVHWVGAWAVSYTFNFLMDWSPSGTIFLYSGVCAASILIVAKVVPGTKGRTLEEIQAPMNSGTN